MVLASYEDHKMCENGEVFGTATRKDNQGSDGQDWQARRRVRSGAQRARQGSLNSL
jgi:hypothetical protein